MVGDWKNYFTPEQCAEMSRKRDCRVLYWFISDLTATNSRILSVTCMCACFVILINKHCMFVACMCIITIISNASDVSIKQLLISVALDCIAFSMCSQECGYFEVSAQQMLLSLTFSGTNHSAPINVIIRSAL